MYTSLKRLAKLFLPISTLSKHEVLFRKIVSFRYKGSTHGCNICSAGLNQFIRTTSNDLLCPNCGSLSRSRRLLQLLKEEDALSGNLLHFSPNKGLYRKLKNINSINYYSTDFEDEFIADHRFDITNIAMKDAFFDTIICFHVLEHIEQDDMAIKELYRVLKSNGTCYIQTPFKEGEIYEDASITSEEDRLKAFGQADHVRIYSVEGLIERLEAVGFKVIRKSFNPQPEDIYTGLKAPETILIASK